MQKSFDRSLLLKLSKAGDFLHEEADPMVWARFESDSFVWFLIAYFPRTTLCYSIMYVRGTSLNSSNHLPIGFLEKINAKRDHTFIPCRVSELYKHLSKTNAPTRTKPVMRDRKSNLIKHEAR